MKIGVTGASGFIGGAVVAEALSHNHEAVAFSRDPEKNISGCEEVRDFSADSAPDLSGLDALIHLSGEPVAGVWTGKKKEEILNSRIRTTQRLVNALWAMDSDERPKVFICASGVGIYGSRNDEWLDEETDAGFGFLAEVVKQWEAVALKAQDMGVRTVLLRIGIVLGEGGGALPLMAKGFSTGLAGKLGNGKQWMPWIHIDDVAGIIHLCLENHLISGPVNVASPNPARNRDFTRSLAEVLKKPAFIPVPSLLIKALPGGMQEMFLNSLRVDPVVMKSNSYDWIYPELSAALRDSIPGEMKETKK